ncbi:hypothetical protein, partial [Anaerobranca gottschalkii]
MKKKIGLIIFMLLSLGIFLYPQYEQWRLDRNLNRMLENGQYEEIYNLLLPEIRENQIDKESKKYYYFLVSLYKTEKNSLFESRFSELIREKNVMVVQRVIDYLGDELIKTYVNQGKTELLLSLIELEGLTFNEDQGYYLSRFIFNGLYFFENEDLIKRAMDLRGEREEIDRIYLTYHYFFGDRNKAIEKYPLANYHCQNTFLGIFFNRWYQRVYSAIYFDRAEYVKELIQEIEEWNQEIEKLNSGILKSSFISNFYRVVNSLK